MLKYLQRNGICFTFVLYNRSDGQARRLKLKKQIHCRVVKLADTPPCLGGEDLGNSRKVK